MAIGLKEGGEREYWLELLHQSGYVCAKDFESTEARDREPPELSTTAGRSPRPAEMTVPDEPKSRLQKYRLTPAGKAQLARLRSAREPS